MKRTRDTDALVRKSIYQRMMDDEFEITYLSKEQKSAILKVGLGDRDLNVKKAFLKLVCEKWIGNVDIFKVLLNIIKNSMSVQVLDKLNVDESECKFFLILINTKRLRIYDKGIYFFKS